MFPFCFKFWPDWVRKLIKLLLSLSDVTKNWPLALWTWRERETLSQQKKSSTVTLVLNLKTTPIFAFSISFVFRKVFFRKIKLRKKCFSWWKAHLLVYTWRRCVAWRKTLNVLLHSIWAVFSPSPCGLTSTGTSSHSPQPLKTRPDANIGIGGWLVNSES